MIETKLASEPEQFQDGEAWHVGRRVLVPDDTCLDMATFVEVRHEVFDVEDGGIATCLFQLASGRLVFVDPAKLSPFPSSKIEEPMK